MKNLKSEVQTPQNKPWFSRNRVFHLIKILVLVGLFVSLFWIIPFENVWSVIQSVNIPLLVAGILFGLILVYIRAIRLNLLTRIQGLDLSTPQLFMINLTVKFYMLFLPGAIVGSGLRWAKISSEGKSAEALASVGFNRLVETFFIVVSGLFWFFMGIEQQKITFWVIGLFLLSIGLLWLIFVWISKLVAAWFSEKDAEKLKPRWQSVWGYLQRIIHSVNLYAKMTFKDLAALFGVNILTHLGGLMSYSLIAKSTGIDISILNLAWTQSVIQLASMTPVSIAGGLGLREASLVVLLPLYGVTKEAALAFSLLLFLRNFLLSLLGGLIELVDILKKRAFLRKS